MNLAEAQLKLRELEDELKKAKQKVIEEALARRNAEKQAAVMEMKYLESEHRDKIEALKGKEKENYEKAKTDPKSGIDYMRGLLGIGSGSGTDQPE